LDVLSIILNVQQVAKNENRGKTVYSGGTGV